MQKALLLISLLAIFTTQSTSLQAQCAAGEVEVFIDVTTDNWGYEAYWELLPGTNSCGSGTLFSGGNPLVGCNGGAAQNQAPGGYGNNLVITEGPWCLDEGSDYTIEVVDDWGDGGTNFDVIIGGLPVESYAGSGAGNRWTFTAAIAPDNDVILGAISLPSYLNESTQTMSVKVFNSGSQTVTELDMNYTVDGGTPVTGNITGLSIAPFTEALVTHPTDWDATLGSYIIDFEVTMVNGSADANPGDNTATKSVQVSEPVPNLVDIYLWNGGTPNVIATGADGLNFPRDLDFHPELSRYEVWVINMDSESSGGSTLTVRNAGKADQDNDWRRDGNAWHFMSLPTGIAFSADNENFATSPGVYDANHDGGAPFTGPSLWSSDPDIYAMPSGGNGSHLDMLHESPLSQGIAWETGNVFWVADGNTNDVVRYDFVDDHGPGNAYHGDALVTRYPEVPVNRISNMVPSHLVLDHATGWLYVIDGANGEINRLDINSGVVGGTPAFAQTEPLTFYGQVTGATVEQVATGLIEPCGIEIKDDRLLVSEHATGEIIVYNLNDPGFAELGRIQTDAQEIMGVRIGPEGNIWYVDAAADELVRLDAIVTGIEEVQISALEVGPTPSSGEGFVRFTAIRSGEAQIEVIDLLGRRVFNQEQDVVAGQALTMPISAGAGTYVIRVSLNNQSLSKRWMVIR